MRRAHTVLAGIAATFICAAPAAAQTEGARAAAETATPVPLPHPGHADRRASVEARPAAKGETRSEQQADPLPGLVKQALEEASAARGARLKADATAAAEFYRARDHAPLWLNDHGFTGQARAVATRLAQAGDDGLDPAAFEIRPPLASSSASERAESEVELTLKVLRFAREARQGRITPSALGELVTATPDDFDRPAFLEKLAGSAGPVALLDEQNPQHPQFQALREELKRLRGYTGSVERIAAIPPGPTLKLGMRDESVPFLRERLKVPARAEADPAVFDPELAAAVRRFQEERGLTVDGVVGSRTREMLNAPVSVTAADIVVNMERWRWLPRDLGEHHVFVNIPEFKLQVVDDGRKTFGTRVIVGQDSNRTPIFSDEIEYVDVNPYWNVPYSIATKEMLPQIQRDPSYIYRQGLQVLYTAGGGEPQLIDPMSVDWSRVSPGNMPFRFRQPPGEANALGRVKFMFPNKHAVYLHDTPTRHLFSRSDRALSHGCVRVDDPIAFADALLSREPSLSGEKIRQLVGGKNGAYPMKVHVPVHLAYFTVWASEGGTMRWSDVYGYDDEMKRLLGVAG